MGRKLGLGIMAASLVAAGAARAATTEAVLEEHRKRTVLKIDKDTDDQMLAALRGVEVHLSGDVFDSIKVFDESPGPVLTVGYGINPQTAVYAAGAAATFDPNEPLPDRLSVNPDSPFYDKDLLARARFGVRFDGKDRPGDVEEYCVSEGWIRVQTYLANGKVRRERGKIICLKKWGKVEPYRK